MPEIEGLYSKDLTFLFGQSLDKAEKSINEMSKTSSNKLNDYAVLDKLSNGKGTEAYQKLSQFRLQSTEYYSAFSFINNKKTFNLNTKEGLNIHVYRNKNQYKKAPHDLNTMLQFVKLGYFFEEGYSPCHNIPINNNTEDSRNLSLQQMLYVLRHKLQFTKTKFALLGNISFRGVPNTSFEGCQFVYNDKTGKLVTDNVNRGTYDFGKWGTSAHFIYDISPWVDIGNGDNVETPQMFIMPADVEAKYIAAIKKPIEYSDNATYSVYKDAVDFIKNSVKNKLGRKEPVSIEDLETNIDGEDYLENEKNRVAIIRVNYINNFIDKNLYRLELSFNDTLNTIDMFCKTINSEEFISGLQMFLASIITNPAITTNYVEENKQSLMKELMKNDLCSSDLDTSSRIDFIIPIDITVEIAQNWRDMLGKISPEEANEEFNRIKDFLTEELNKRLEKFHITLRPITDNNEINDFSIINYGCKISRCITSAETVICGKTNFQRNMQDCKDDFHLNKVETEATEMLNVYHKPEYK